MFVSGNDDDDDDESLKRTNPFATRSGEMEMLMVSP
jgi:hypothetical protein